MGEDVRREKGEKRKLGRGGSERSAQRLSSEHWGECGEIKRKRNDWGEKIRAKRVGDGEE